MKNGETLLVRGGTTSVGLAAIAIARHQQLHVVATTRRAERKELLMSYGAESVVIETGTIRNEIRAIYAEGVDAVLELVGSTLPDSATCVGHEGRITQLGVVGGNTPAIARSINYQFYGGEQEDFHALPLQDLLDLVADGRLPVKPGKVFQFEQIQEAHATMEGNKAGGKIVVLT